MNGRQSEPLIKSDNDPYPGQDYGVVPTDRKLRRSMKKFEASAERLVEESDKVVEKAAVKVSDAVSTLKNKSMEIVHKSEWTLKKERPSLQSLIERNPIAIGLAAFLIGALIAVLVPQTDTENQMFGAARQKLLMKAKSAANELRDKAETGVKEIAETIHDQIVGQFEEEG